MSSDERKRYDRAYKMWQELGKLNSAHFTLAEIRFLTFIPPSDFHTEYLTKLEQIYARVSKLLKANN